MNLKHKNIRYFTVLLLLLAVVSTFLSIVILPQIIVGPPRRASGLNMVYLVDMWRSQGLTLPYITTFAVKFGEAYLLRYILAAVLILGLVALEIICKNQIITGSIHIIFLILSVILGYLILLSALIPMMPLKV